MAGRWSLGGLALGFLACLMAAENGCQGGPDAVAGTRPAANREAGPVTIPDLPWQPRSDWVNVKTAVTPPATGDGKADDTAALQAALDKVVSGTTLYLPPGVYRITKTLNYDRPRPLGVSIIGHGRSTIIRWDGPVGGRMLWIHGGAVDSRYLGLTWDGNHTAAVGIQHASKTFETENLHQDEAFLNFADAGILIGQPVPEAGPQEAHQESAEFEYTNCLFENCRRGVAFVQFNDYDNTFDGCEFRRCAIAIQDLHGNVYARNCHFENSSIADLSIASEHGSSARRCTSTGSIRFLELAAQVVPMTLQDCHVANWQAADGAIKLSGGPVLMMDCSFDVPAGGTAPVRLDSGDQRLILSNNTVHQGTELLQPGNQTHVVTLAAGKRSGVIQSATRHFLKETVVMPGKTFDAKTDFGAKADGVTDDTSAIQQTIDAARKHGQGALAYLPAGTYLLRDTLQVTGANYTLGGSGLKTCLIWKGDPAGTMIAIKDPDHVVLENLNVGSHDAGAMINQIDILQTSSGRPCDMTYDNVATYGYYQKKPEVKGLRLVGLPAGSTVHFRHLQGNTHFTDSAQATILVDSSYEGSITVEGKDKRRGGFLGFQMRLTTICTHAVYVRDNQNLVMTDSYVEQADNCYSFQGGPDDPPGRIVIQGPKSHSKAGPVTIDNYGGAIFLGHNQYYLEPNPAVIVQSGTQPLDLILAANMFYGTTPEIRHAPNTRLTLLGNQHRDAKIADTGVVEDAFTPEGAAIAADLLDELRRLGQLDIQLNYPELAYPGKHR